MDNFLPFCFEFSKIFLFLGIPLFLGQQASYACYLFILLPRDNDSTLLWRLLFCVIYLLSRYMCLCLKRVWRLFDAPIAQSVVNLLAVPSVTGSNPARGKYLYGKYGYLHGLRNGHRSRGTEVMDVCIYIMYFISLSSHYNIKSGLLWILFCYFECD